MLFSNLSLTLIGLLVVLRMMDSRDGAGEALPARVLRLGVGAGVFPGVSPFEACRHGLRGKPTNSYILTLDLPLI